MTDDMLFRMVFALLLVLGLLGLFATALRLWGHKLGLVATLPSLSGKKRMQLVETMMLDARHRTVIIRCDETDHVVILGGSQPVPLSSCPKKSSD
jgi:flagellar protein FliO/FliZ